MLRNLLLVAAILLFLASAPALAQSYNLTVVSTSGGGVTAPISANYSNASPINLAAATSSFVSWQLLNSSGADVTAACLSNSTAAAGASLNALISPDNYTLRANYGHYLTIVANQNSGYISGTVTPASGAIFSPGQQVTLAATTNSTHGFGHWQISPTASPATDVTNQLLAFGDITNPMPHANLQGTGYSFLMPNYDLTITYTMSALGCGVGRPLYPATKALYNITMTPSSYFMPTQSFTFICNPVNGYGIQKNNAAGQWSITPTNAAVFSYPLFNHSNSGTVAIVTPNPANGGVYTSSLTQMGQGTLLLYNSGNPSEESLLTISPSAGGSVTLWSGPLASVATDTYTVFPAPNPGYTFSGWSVAALSHSIGFTSATISGYTYYYSSGGYNNSGNNFPIGSDSANFTLINFPAVTLATNPAGLTLPNVTGAAPYHYGDTPTLTAANISGYTFLGWTVSAGSLLNSSTNLYQAVLTVQGSAAVTANYASSTNSVTVIQTANGAVSVSPSLASYNYFASLTVTASALPGYAFVCWNVSGGAVSPTASLATLVVLGNVTLSASFAPAWPLTVNPSTGGSVSVSPSLPAYYIGYTASITASPAIGYNFVNWIVTNATLANSLSASTTLTTQGAVTLAASFSPINYSVTVQLTPAGWVTYSPSTGPHHYGDVLTLVATPSHDCQFSSWNVTGATIGPNLAATTATITGNVVLAAAFTASFTDVITINGNGGSLTISPSQAAYNYGATLTITAQPASGYLFVSWLATGGAVDNPYSAQANFTVYNDFSLTASFTPFSLDAAINNAWLLAAAKLNASVAYFHTTYPSTSLTLYPASANYGSPWAVVTPNTLPGWVSGCFPGCLWLTYQQLGDPAMLTNAENWTAYVATANVVNNYSGVYAPIDHDLGFRNLPSFYNGYLINDDSTDPAGAYRASSKATLLNAAAALNLRFNEGGIQVGGIKNTETWCTPYGIIVDTMMNIKLLFVGWDLSGRPTTVSGTNSSYVWYSNAVTHANTTISQNLRSFSPTDPRAADDGSTYHCVLHNDGTNGSHSSDGSIFGKENLPGFAPESTWSRGHAWTIYGFAETYRYTKDDPSVNPANFLSAARRVSNYFISHLPNNYSADPYNYCPGDFVPPEDFDAALGEPAGPYSTNKVGTHAFVNRDSSAAAVAAAGLLDLYTLDPDPAQRAYWFQSAQNILNCLLTYSSAPPTLDYLNTFSSPTVSILIRFGGGFGSAYGSNIIADYYFLDAITRYQDLTAPLQVSAALSPSQTWVYQNTPGTLANNGGHALTLNLNVAGNASPWLSSTVTQTGPGNLTISSVSGNPLVYNLQGSLRLDDVTGVGVCSLHVLVANDLGASGSTDLVIAVRRLGDLTGDGFVTTADRVALTAYSHGLYSGPLPPAAFDLANNGGVNLAADMTILTNLLNDLPVP